MNQSTKFFYQGIPVLCRNTGITSGTALMSQRLVLDGLPGSLPI